LWAAFLERGVIILLEEEPGDLVPALGLLWSLGVERWGLVG